MCPAEDVFLCIKNEGRGKTEWEGKNGRVSQLVGQSPFLLPWGEEGDREVTQGCASLGVCRESPAGWPCAFPGKG